MEEQKYIRGFNDGYLLAKHMPTLLSKLTKNLKVTNDFVEGILMGKEEFDLEHSRTQTDELKRLRNKSQNRDKGHERD